mmetsp:Transcript_77135/g.165290  ORF Transcript_77135/g.165290 Transcript_77135/m.165290 type:complete len:210 (+) Transcript_77135:556-1185(+)
MQLPQHHACRPVGLRFDQLPEKLFWNRLPSLIVKSHLVHGGLVINPVFHELRGLLNCVPINVVDARGQAFRFLREHMLQRVAKLVEQSLDVAEVHETGLVPDGRRSVAYYVGHRHAHLLACGHKLRIRAASTHVAHPSATLFRFWVRVRVEEKVGGSLALLFHGEHKHVVAPQRHVQRLACSRVLLGTLGGAHNNLPDVHREQTLGQRP